jgi:hypothetical protein
MKDFRKIESELGRRGRRWGYENNDDNNNNNNNNNQKHTL